MDSVDTEAAGMQSVMCEEVIYKRNVYRNKVLPHLY